MPKPFTPEELNALYQMLREYQEKVPTSDDEYYDDYYDEYKELINEKIVSSLLKKVRPQIPKEAKEKIDKDFLRQKYHSYNNFINERVYRTLKNAFEQLRTTEISYFNMDNAEFKKRSIDVYYTSAKYTIGYCHLRKAIRKFRTSRIASAKLVDQRYTIPKTFNKKDY